MSNTETQFIYDFSIIDNIMIETTNTFINVYKYIDNDDFVLQQKLRITGNSNLPNSICIIKATTNEKYYFSVISSSNNSIDIFLLDSINMKIEYIQTITIDNFLKNITYNLQIVNKKIKLVYNITNVLNKKLQSSKIGNTIDGHTNTKFPTDTISSKNFENIGTPPIITSEQISVILFDKIKFLDETYKCVYISGNLVNYINVYKADTLVLKIDNLKPNFAIQLNFMIISSTLKLVVLENSNYIFTK